MRTSINKRLHLIYPNSTSIKAPETIGRHVSTFFDKKFDVVNYDWRSTDVIIPNPGDILIGHAHPNPNTIFRRSVKHKGWGYKILMEPFNTDLNQIGFISRVIGDCDIFLAITGKYWFEELNNSLFKKYKDRMVHLDLAVDRREFRHAKLEFSEIGKRKFLYIGNASRPKNIPLLLNLAKKIGVDKFGVCGCIVGELHSHGFVDFATEGGLSIIKNYDFLIMTSRCDANPTTILEAMAWGLIPICTPQCGYIDEAGIFNIPLNNLNKAADILVDLDHSPDVELKKIVKINHQRLDQYYNWNRFCDVIDTAIRACNHSQIQNFTLIEKAILNFYCIKSIQYKLYLKSIFRGSKMLT